MCTPVTITTWRTWKLYLNVQLSIIHILIHFCSLQETKVKHASQMKVDEYPEMEKFIPYDPLGKYYIHYIITAPILCLIRNYIFSVNHTIASFYLGFLSFINNSFPGAFWSLCIFHSLRTQHVEALFSLDVKLCCIYPEFEKYSIPEDLVPLSGLALPGLACFQKASQPSVDDLEKFDPLPNLSPVKMPKCSGTIFLLEMKCKSIGNK